MQKKMKIINHFERERQKAAGKEILSNREAKKEEPLGEAVFVTQNYVNAYGTVLCLSNQNYQFKFKDG